MYQITKTFRFAAAHQLSHLPEDHKCHRLHGHNYTVTLTLAAAILSDDGFVVDYGDLSATFGAWLDDRFDHRNLNDIFDPADTTAEALAEYFYTAAEQWPWHHQLAAVEVCETEKTSATFTP